MSSRLRLLPPLEIERDRVEYAATLERDGHAPQTLWWRVPACRRDAVTAHADPFVIGLAFPMMQAGEDVEIVGPVSPSLLANVETFMETWHLWVPARYGRVRLWSADEREADAPAEPYAFVMPFSAGVDACFTAYRHARNLAGRNTRRIGLAATIFGFDIRSHQPNAATMYAGLRDSARAMLGDLGIPHVEVETNFRTLDTPWIHSHSTQLISGLSLFSRQFGGAMLANSLPFNNLGVEWGSHPIVDAMLSTKQFPILDDGGPNPRWAKIGLIADWPVAMAHLRVCSGWSNVVGNCGRCEKCVRTALGFRVVGRSPAAGLLTQIGRKEFAAVRLLHPIMEGFWHDLLAGAAAHGRSDEAWVAGVRGVLRRTDRARRVAAFRRSIGLRRRLRKLVGRDAPARK